MSVALLDVNVLIALLDRRHVGQPHSLEIVQKLSALLEKCRQVVLDDAPDQSVVDGGVLVGELIAKADDLWCLIDLGKSFLVSLRELIKCLTDDRELPLNRRANQAAVAVIIEVDASDGLLDGLTSLDHIVEEGPRITLQISCFEASMARRM